MPVYKGTTEITSGKLYKATTNIENGYKGTNSFYVNQTTQSFAVPTSSGFTFNTPANIVGVPGQTISNTSFTGTISSGASTKWVTGTGSVSGLPAGLTATVSYPNQSYNTTVTVTISGTYPTTSNSNIALTISGLTINTAVAFNYTLQSTGSASTSSSNAGNVYTSSGLQFGSFTVNLSISSGQFSGSIPAGTILGTNDAFKTGGALDSGYALTTTLSSISNTGGTFTHSDGFAYNASAAGTSPGPLTLTGTDATAYVTFPFGYIGTDTGGLEKRTFRYT
tara:strand:- start:266 stop:1105 length:840 start_codon:yes stop_codon:yes gene_type:complete